MRSERRLRIGLILASIHTGSSPTLWKAVHEEAERQGVDLFIFPGGPLEAGELFEKQLKMMQKAGSIVSFCFLYRAGPVAVFSP